VWRSGVEFGYGVEPKECIIGDIEPVISDSLIVVDVSPECQLSDNKERDGIPYKRPGLRAIIHLDGP
jgi:hypothetical protein